MKKSISILIAALFFIFFVSCSRPASGSGPVSEGKISIVSTIFAPYDFTRQITGELADISMLLPPGSESHSYELTPQDIIKAQNCDVFIYAGGESDEWISGMLASMDTSKIKIVTLMDCVELVREEIAEGMEHDEHKDESGHEEPEGEENAYDEHVWTSPKNAKLIVSKISEAVCEADPENAAVYKENTAAYLGKLDVLDAAFQSVVNNAARKTIVFGDRFPFRYFADTYGLAYFAAFPGCSTETEPSAATVAFLISKVKSENIPVIFTIELSNQKMAGTISESTGAKVLRLHSCHNVEKSDFEAGVTYLELMEKNVEALREALN